MLTPQEITEVVFAKARFGGYDMTEVDDFLEAVYSDYTALYKENAILKGKLKVLVEKVEEYRSTEDSMRMALLTAQRMGEEITTEANKIKDETLRNADLEVKARLAETARRIADEELRLSVAAKETAKFIELSHAIMNKHAEFLSKLQTARRTVPVDSPQEPASSAAASPPLSLDEKISDTADIIGNVMDILTGNSESSSVTAAQPGQHSSAADYDDDEQTRIYTIDDDADSVTPRPKFDFDDLRFGSNFNADDDE